MNTDDPTETSMESRFLGKLRDLPTVMPQELIMQMREGIARIEVKLDVAVALSSEVDALRDKVIRLEAWQKFAAVVAGAIWALTLVVVAGAMVWVH